MLELLTIVIFCWLSFKLLGLFFRIAWGAAKFFASVLFVIALPMLVLCLMFAGGMLLMIPLGLLALALGILLVSTAFRIWSNYLMKKHQK